MPRSLANGDYSLVLAIESSSRPDSWYRLLADRSTNAFSCDCPKRIFFNGQQRSQVPRTCPHTDFGRVLTGPSLSTQARRVGSVLERMSPADLLEATKLQWPGLRGQWSIDGRVAQINGKPYQIILLRLALGNGGVATGVVAFAEAHHHSRERVLSRVAGWCGFAIAAEVARLGGFPMAGQPPEHFKVPSRGTRRRTEEARPRPSERPTT